MASVALERGKRANSFPLSLGVNPGYIRLNLERQRCRDWGEDKESGTE